MSVTEKEQLKEIDSEFYRFPTKGLLASEDLTEALKPGPINLESAESLAKELGFVQIAHIGRGQSFLELYSASKLDIPAFPVGKSDLIEYMAIRKAIINGQLTPTHVIVAGDQRYPYPSTNPLIPFRFANEIEEIHDLYIQPDWRRRIQEKVEVPEYAATASMLGCAGLGALIGLSPEAALIGLAGGTLPGGGIGFALRRRLKKRQENLRTLQTGLANKDAVDLLQSQIDHSISAMIKKQLYRRLQDQYPDLEPPVFLNNIYSELAPMPLMSKRAAEFRHLNQPTELREHDNSEYSKLLLKVAQDIMESSPAVAA